MKNQSFASIFFLKKLLNLPDYFAKNVLNFI